MKRLSRSRSKVAFVGKLRLPAHAGLGYSQFKTFAEDPAHVSKSRLGAIGPNAVSAPDAPAIERPRRDPRRCQAATVVSPHAPPRQSTPRAGCTDHPSVGRASFPRVA